MIEAEDQAATLAEEEVKRHAPDIFDVNSDVVESARKKIKLSGEMVENHEVVVGDEIVDVVMTTVGTTDITQVKKIQLAPSLFARGRIQVSIVKSIVFIRDTTGNSRCTVYLPTSPTAESPKNTEIYLSRNVLANFKTDSSAVSAITTVPVNRVVPFPFVLVEVSPNAVTVNVRVNWDVHWLSPKAYWDMVTKDYDIDLDATFLWSPATFSTPYSKNLLGWNSHDPALG